MVYNTREEKIANVADRKAHRERKQAEADAKLIKHGVDFLLETGCFQTLAALRKEFNVSVDCGLSLVAPEEK